MAIYIALAFFNGILIGVAQVLNARLATSISPIAGSTVNHIIGFCALLLIMSLTVGFGFLSSATSLPLPIYAGGVIGAVFVAINSWVLSKLGAMRAFLLVLGGQMIWGSVIDVFNNSVGGLWAQFLGISLILAGVWIARRGTSEQKG